MNFFDLGLLPSGRLHVFLSTTDKTKEQKATITDAQLKILSDAFKHSSSEGLFKLAIRKSTSGFSPSLQYWRHFSRQYLSERCQLNADNQKKTDAQQFTPIEPLTANETAPLLLNAPPMRGAEYLSEEVLQNIRGFLDNWVCEQSQTSGGLDAFLKKHAPQWHQVGRVCFHLAENKNDPDCPFAFMATYAPELSEHGQIRYQPLSRALQEYTGTKNKKALIRLLSPVQLAAESSSLIKDLVDSGDLYHPLAWSVEEAYSFLKDAALYEQCGLVVRLPNWWKNRTKPRIGITIGESKQKNFNADSLLDFKLHIALGDESLSKAELQELMEVKNGLTFVKGQWIEVDQEKLREALAHWEKVESQTARGGLTFAEGMRLLAGAPADLAKDELEDSREWSFVQPGKWLSTQLEALHSPDQMKAAKPGKALHATLRPYQQTGVNWLWLLAQLGLGACLADDMGLGKTMQIISLLLITKKKNTDTPSLLVLPASLLANWQAELSRFAPSLRCLFLHSSQLNKTEMMRIPPLRISTLS